MRPIAASAGHSGRPVPDVMQRWSVDTALIRVLAAGVLVLAGCGGGPPAPVDPAANAAGLETVTVRRAPIARETAFDGIVEAVNESTVAAQTSGRVVELPFDVGDYVPKDALIARLTDSEQRARMEAVRGTLAEARARLTEARLNYDRVRDLQQRQLIARAELDRAAATLDSAQARMEAAQAAVDEAEEQLGYTVIRAPYAGTVVERHVQMGETVTPGRTLLTGLSLEHLRVVVEVPQQRIGPLRVHERARVLFNGSSVEAAELRIPPKADITTHTFRVLVSLPEGDHGVFPGTLVKVAFVSGETEALLIPAGALVERGEVTGVYVVADDRVSLRYVRTGTPTAEGDVPILSGLHDGDRIATDPIAAGIAYKSQAEVSGGEA
jgi:RND family efflux transporter MFP subunit